MAYTVGIQAAYGDAMPAHVNRRFLLKVRPTGQVGPEHFDYVEEDVPSPLPGQALVRTIYLSVDPANRIWMSDIPSYIPPVGVGKVMRGVGLGQIVASERDDLRAGQLVLGLTNWQDYELADDTLNEIPFTPLPEHLSVPLTHTLGVLGFTGMTAYFGLNDIAKPQSGETVVVSAAAGAVGSIVGQIANLQGARTIGIAGSAEKCRWLTDELGFAAAVNYKEDDWTRQLDAATPSGVDVYWDNVGGAILEEALPRLNLEARIVLCGLLSQYNSFNADAPPPVGPRNFEQLLMKRVLLKGFIIFDFARRFPEAQAALADWLSAGKLAHHETVVEGLDRAPEHLSDMFAGSNVGKLLIHVGDPD
ncbi:MAG TPA: NADP-dependent oxidoreductase [Solirubrobacteraceae bacterium]|jgi:NADPH-dependent curcumin reductase CurA|nr:NADP-dependent oxidoreductase [Solirubrobacteraceae bacterium]